MGRKIRDFAVRSILDLSANRAIVRPKATQRKVPKNSQSRLLRSAVSIILFVKTNL